MSAASNLWMIPPDELVLSEDEIHLWKAKLNVPSSQIRLMREVLSQDELKRADRFYFEKDRNGFTVARGALRTVLSRYVNAKPDKLVFNYNSYGKPSLKAEFNSNKLRFNLSHSHHLALIAVTLNYEIGVDVEWMRNTLSDMQIAERFFSQSEVAALRLVPAIDQKTAFFNCWTRKEAFIKAKGKGLSIPLAKFDVSLKPGEPAALLETRFQTAEASNWAIYDVSPESGYRGAIAVQNTQKKIVYWQFAMLSFR